jgi:hypothetical protein
MKNKIVCFLDTTHNACYVSIYKNDVLINRETHFYYDHVFELLDYNLYCDEIYLNDKRISFESLESDYNDFMGRES